jgi:phosphoribosylaminoimidazole (AIR) synthetase
MYQTFNMGMGFAVIVAKEDLQESMKLLQKYSSSTVQVVGYITKGSGVSVPTLKLIYD